MAIGSALYFIFLLKVNKDPSMSDLENMVSEFVDNDTSPINILFSLGFY